MGYLAPVPRPLYLELRPRLPAPINVSTSSTSYLKFSHYDHAHITFNVYWLFKPYWLTHVTCSCFKETVLLCNVYVSCFVDFILSPTDKYMFKVNNKKIVLIYSICSKLKINTAWHRSVFFIFDFAHSLHINMTFPFSKYFEQVFVNRVWKTSHNVLKAQKAMHLFCSCKANFIQWFIIAPNWNKWWTMSILWTYVSAINLLLESQAYYHRFVPFFDLLYHRFFREI